MLNRVNFNQIPQPQRNSLSFGISPEKLTKIMDENIGLSVDVCRHRGQFIGFLKSTFGPVHINNNMIFGYGKTTDQMYQGIADKINEGNILKAREHHICTVA